MNMRLHFKSDSFLIFVHSFLPHFCLLGKNRLSAAHEANANVIRVIVGPSVGSLVVIIMSIRLREGFLLVHVVGWLIDELIDNGRDHGYVAVC